MEVAEGEVVLVPELPREIIWYKILPRLPAKSLMRFKCVCKPWLSLITRDPSFLSAYQNFHSNLNNTHLLLKVEDTATKHQHFLSLEVDQEHILPLQINQEDGIESSSPTTATATTTHLLTLDPQEYPLYKIQCVNSLVCFFFDNDHPIRIFNPCTRESITLPNATAPTNSCSSSPTLFLENERPTVDIENCFGFNPLTNEFMVLQVQLSKFLHELASNCITMAATINIQICTLGTDMWRCVEVDHPNLPFDPISWHFDNDKKSVCLHGAIHWLHDGGKYIVVFDLGEERFRVIPLPPVDNDGNWHGSRKIVDVGGCLALTHEKTWRGTVLWVLKDYQNQVWVKENIDDPDLWYAYRSSPSCRIHKGKLGSQASLKFYNTKTEKFWTSSIVLPKGIYRNDDYCTRLDVLSSYNETIAPLKPEVSNMPDIPSEDKVGRLTTLAQQKEDSNYGMYLHFPFNLLRSV